MFLVAAGAYFLIYKFIWSSTDRLLSDKGLNDEHEERNMNIKNSNNFFITLE